MSYISAVLAMSSTAATLMESIMILTILYLIGLSIAGAAYKWWKQKTESSSIKMQYVLLKGLYIVVIVGVIALVLAVLR